MQVTIHNAKTNLSKLIEAALAGEEVVIAKGKRPIARLVPVQQNSFTLGLLKAELGHSVPDFLAPMDEDELARWESGA